MICLTFFYLNGIYANDINFYNCFNFYNFHTCECQISLFTYFLILLFTFSEIRYKVIKNIKIAI